MCLLFNSNPDVTKNLSARSRFNTTIIKNPVFNVHEFTTFKANKLFSLFLTSCICCASVHHFTNEIEIELQPR